MVRFNVYNLERLQMQFKFLLLTFKSLWHADFLVMFILYSTLEVAQIQVDGNSQRLLQSAQGPRFGSDIIAGNKSLFQAYPQTITFLAPECLIPTLPKPMLARNSQWNSPHSDGEAGTWTCTHLTLLSGARLPYSIFITHPGWYKCQPRKVYGQQCNILLSNNQKELECQINPYINFYKVGSRFEDLLLQKYLKSV